MSITLAVKVKIKNKANKINLITNKLHTRIYKNLNYSHSQNLTHYKDGESTNYMYLLNKYMRSTNNEQIINKHGNRVSIYVSVGDKAFQTGTVLTKKENLYALMLDEKC